jgi:hypothetical protein
VTLERNETRPIFANGGDRRAAEAKLRPLRDDLMLSESGFDSLCFAILVARLEDVLGFDLFGTSSEALLP